MNKRPQQRVIGALRELSSAAKAYGEQAFLGDDEDDADSEGFTRVGRRMVRAIERADKALAAVAKESP